MNNYLESQVRQDAESTLRSRITYWIKQNVDHGIGGMHNVTYRIIFNEEPDLFRAVSRTRVFQLCKELHASEDLELTMDYTKLFDDFNRKYFGGSLPQYQVRVVEDIFGWIAAHEDLLLNLIDLGGENVNLVDPFDPYYYSSDGLQPSRIDLLGRQIVLPAHEDDMHEKDCQLIHHMARAATGTIADRDVRWHPEMRRLRNLGAPVGDKYLDFRLRTGEHVG
jgi:hypothetical protein